MALELFSAMWRVSLELSPWLLLGLAVAGVLHTVLPRRLVRRGLGGRRGVLRAVLLGVPLPLCSCGVIPAGLGLRRDGAGRGAAVGFLISTPQTGVDSILVSASFLGWPFALFKVAAAFVTGVVGGWVTDALDREESPALEPAVEDGGSPRSWRDGLWHALDILRTIWHWIVFGVFVSAAIEVFVPPTLFSDLAGAGRLVPVLGALAISLPLYVCATASVPIAASLVATGMPAGAALVFLMAGPATNVATIGAVRRALGGRALAIYLTTLIGGSVAAGLLFDFLIDTSGVVASGHQHPTGWWAAPSAVVLAGLLAWFAFDSFRRLVSRRPVGIDSEPRFEIAVAGMTCGGCVARLEKALRGRDGVSGARVTLEPARAVVQGRITEAEIRSIIEGAGFRAG